MTNREAALLQRALCYEAGHPRRTQHILKVHALAELLGTLEALPEEELQRLGAAAILHDIAIKPCKERYNGDASQGKQRQEAPALVRQFLQEAGYPEAWTGPVTELVLRHHDYDGPRSRTLQLLVEADLIVNCYEDRPAGDSWERIRAVFATEAGTALLRACQQGGHPEQEGSE